MEVNKFVSGGIVQVRIVCTAKLTFSHSSPVKVWGAYCTCVRIVFEILRYSTRATQLHCTSLQTWLMPLMSLASFFTVSS